MPPTQALTDSWIQSMAQLAADCDPAQVVITLSDLRAALSAAPVEPVVIPQLTTAAPVEPVAPIYQLQGADGRWIDQTWSSYDYNKRYGQTVRVVYAAPVPAEPAPTWQPIETAPKE